MDVGDEQHGDYSSTDISKLETSTDNKYILPWVRRIKVGLQLFSIYPSDRALVFSDTAKYNGHGRGRAWNLFDHSKASPGQLPTAREGASLSNLKIESLTASTSVGGGYTCSLRRLFSLLWTKGSKLLI
jgi:hypothetical protein